MERRVFPFIFFIHFFNFPFLFLYLFLSAVYHEQTIRYLPSLRPTKPEMASFPKDER